MTNGPLNRKFKMGLVGGGQGSFIGRVHSIAACLDNRATLVAGTSQQQSRAIEGFGCRLRCLQRASLWFLPRDVRGGIEETKGGANRFCFGDHAEPHAL